MKIIRGIYSNRNINVVGRTRPPLCRIRHAVFDILENQGFLEGKTVVDLCAGSGSFGLEALSRGAHFTYFFEENVETAKNLMSTLESWNVTNAKVVIKNIKYLPRTEEKIDLIFFDPPFGHNYIEYMQNRIVEKGWANENTRMIIRYNEQITCAPK